MGARSRLLRVRGWAVPAAALGSLLHACGMVDRANVATDSGGPDSSIQIPDGGADAPTDSAACWQGESARANSEAGVACELLAAALCERMSSCMPGEWYFSSGPSHMDPTMCRARMAIGCPDQLSLPGSPTPASLALCANQLPNVSCADVYDATRFGNGWSSVALTYASALWLCGTHGTRAEGEPCDGDIQCASGNCQRPNPDTACGTCTKFKTVGEDCQGPGPCEYGLYCRGTCTPNDAGGCTVDDWQCAPYGQEGSACQSWQMPNPSTSVGCGAGLHCVDDTCVATNAVGEPCTTSREYPPYCNDFRGEHCDPETARCAFSPPNPSPPCFTKDGETCERNTMGEWTGCITPCLYPATQTNLDWNLARCDLPEVRCKL